MIILAICLRGKVCQFLYMRAHIFNGSCVFFLGFGLFFEDFLNFRPFIPAIIKSFPTFFPNSYFWNQEFI